MNISLQKPNIQSKARIKPATQTPFSLPHDYSFNNNKYEDRPLNQNSMNLNFKGLSFTGTPSMKVADAMKSFGEDFGQAALEGFKTKLAKTNSIKRVGLNIENETITFKDKPLIKRMGELLIYPVKDMPIDLANSVVKGFKKINALKDSNFVKNLESIKVLKDRRDLQNAISDAAGIRHYIEMKTDKNSKIFAESQKRFNPLISNYDSTVEKTVTRVVTGMIPAFYLANDAYNLSIYVNNNKDVAAKEKKRRFNQEVARIGITAGATFGVLRLFSKSSNASSKVTVLLMGGITLVSEFVGRLLVGTPILPLSEKSAEEYVKKHKKNVPATENKQGKDLNFSANTEAKKAHKSKKDKDGTPPEKGNLTFKNVFKVIGLLALAGFGIEKAKKTKVIKEILKPINDAYKTIYTKDYKISKSEYKALTEKLRANGFDKIADNYDKSIQRILNRGNLQFKDLWKYNSEVDAQVNDIIKKKHPDFSDLDKTKQDEIKAGIKKTIKPQDVIKKLNLQTNLNDEYYYIGAKKKKFAQAFIHQFLAFPIRYAWDVAMAPYKTLAKPILEKLDRLLNKKKMWDPPKGEKLPSPDEMMQNSLSYLKKIDKVADYKNKVTNSLFESLDNETKSGYSNASLASTIRVVTNTVTSGFLIADNYNMVMIESKGQDEDLAQQKAKERTIQRGVRIAYGAFLTKLFNGIFAKTFNASLLGAQTVNVGSTLVVETMERKSVGLPIGESSQENIKEEERKHLTAEGFIGSYYRFMAKLTGKKSFAQQSKEKAAKAEKQKAKQPETLSK